MKNQKHVFLDILLPLLLVIQQIIHIYPPLYFLPMRLVITTIAIILCLMIIMFFDFNFFIKKIHIFLLLFLVLIFMFILPYASGNQTMGNRYLYLFPLFATPVIGVYIANRNPKTLMQILIIVVPFIIVTIIISSYRLLDAPYLIRTIKSKGEYSEHLLLQGIGNYDFVYLLVLTTPLLQFVFANKKVFNNKKMRIYLFLIWLLSLFLIILSNYFIALIIILFTTILIFLTNSSSQRKTIIFPIIIILFLVVLFSWPNSIIKVIETIQTIFPEGKNSLRLDELKESLMGQGEGLTNERWKLLAKNIKSFQTHPILGIVYFIPNLTLEETLGQHSFYFDTLSLFGLIGFIVVAYLINETIFMGTKSKEIKIKSFSFIFLIGVTMILVFNNATPSMSYAFLLYILIIKQWSKNPVKKMYNNSENSENLIAFDMGVPKIE